jgi:aerobic-type carbon monoxide dehydrogenase small subunit (CoxS/CutS family)
MKDTFYINNNEVEMEFSSSEKLLDTLRNNGFTEVKDGCKSGNCGACVILLDEKPVNSCQVYTASVVNRKITTIKGLGSIQSPHPIQKAFVDAAAVQCGFCTPGMILSAYGLLSKNPSPDKEQIKEALDGNLCRCTGYVKIIEAVQLAAKRMAEK